MKNINSQNKQYNKYSTFQRQDAILQFMNFNPSHPKTRHTRRRKQSSMISDSSTFTNHIQLNKGKKYLKQEQRITEIQRHNRLLHQKLAKLAARNKEKTQTSEFSRGKSKTDIKKRSRTIPTSLPSLDVQKQYQFIKNSQVTHLSKNKNKNASTLFMGHSKIDDVDFKIKIVVSEGIYYLIAQNQHTKIILEMPQEQYWPLHYKEFQQNPCNIFQYLKIQKGQISFRVQQKQTKKQSKSKRKINKFTQQIKQQMNNRYKQLSKGKDRSLTLPKI